MQNTQTTQSSLNKYTYLKSSNAEYIDEVFERYLQDPSSVDESWRWFFEGIEIGSELAPSLEPSEVAAPIAPAGTSVDWASEVRVADLIQTYRRLGKKIASIDPLSPAPSSVPELELSAFGLSNADLGKSFQAAKLAGLSVSKLSDILAHLKATYCGTIAVEFSHIENTEARQWLLQQMESTRNRTAIDSETRKLIYRRLTEAETLERFLHTRYVAQKRFSVEGGESVIPLLDCVIEKGAELGAHDFVIGMAHRGRLNILTHTLGKPVAHLFTEFEGTYKSHTEHGEGDVKYHKGYSRDLKTRQGKPVHLSLAFNPSHLEFVNPVIEGSVRAKQDRYQDAARKKVIPIQIHGDAAFSGQGVCFETLQMQSLRAYGTGGTIHIIINNQVGFTTSPVDSRSTPYSTDLARMLDSPIFHVSGDDPEAVWHVARLSIEWRQKFGTDAFIDLVCYRKHGHNEGDEPSFTQPLLYKKIRAHTSTRELYGEALTRESILGAGEAQQVVDQVTEAFSEAQKLAKATPQDPVTSVFDGDWKTMKKPESGAVHDTVKTSVSASALTELAEKINVMPAGFNLNSKLNRFYEARLKAVKDGKGIDWGNAEALAYASLLSEGHTVRITGQDAERGTFTHRHAVVTDSESGNRHTPQATIAQKGAKYEIFNSHLSETAAMGFEYGYSLAAPQALVVWEAQFGDFANGAQVIIDQFIATSESKWQRMNGLVLLLPHGYEGQGPEHSSARLERFLQLCGKENMAVVNLSTPAQIFHALRRQVKRDFRKPLIVMSPKSMLRHPLAISTLGDLSDVQFQEVIDCPEHTTQPEKVRKVLLCSGKVYYDLVAERTNRKVEDVAIVRVEQLYPWPAAKLAAILNRYSKAREIVWVQEEPRNMGAWSHVFNYWMGGLDLFMSQVGDRPIRYAGRGIASSPAVGSPKVHEAELKAFLAEALT